MGDAAVQDSVVQPEISQYFKKRDADSHHQSHYQHLQFAESGSDVDVQVQPKLSHHFTNQDEVNQDNIEEDTLSEIIVPVSIKNSQFFDNIREINRKHILDQSDGTHASTEQGK